MRVVNTITIIITVVFLIILPVYCFSENYSIGYFQGGSFSVYTKTWNNTVAALEDRHLYGDIKIKYFESPGWDQDNKVYDSIAKKLMADKELDLIITVGTLATRHVLNNNNGKTPILALALSDALESGFIKSVGDTGVDNFTTRYAPKRWLMLADTFYFLSKCKNVGFIYPDTKNGRVYANIEQWKEISQKYGFKISVRHVSEEETCGEVRDALRLLIQEDKIDTFYISALLPFGFNNSTSEELIKYLTANKVVTLSRDGCPHVQKGALFGVTGDDWGDVGKFHADQIYQILKLKKKPCEVNHIYKTRFTLAFNTRTAEILEFSVKQEYFYLFGRIYTSVPWEE